MLDHLNAKAGCGQKEGPMSYQEAERCFEDNKPRLDANRDPVLYNLNNGLLALTRALRSDLQEIRQAMRQGRPS